ncbi:MAG TPA: carboxypeptidase-like regulatory domain-containing protein [Methylomirabilota bacterium]|nr:carboxypeptidase-like regulatory domain-containing protein [Methylomirabilota bacterium]
MRRIALLCSVLTALAATPAAAEHEVFYRYTVLGYVTDAAGTPRPGQTVTLVRDKTGFSYLGDTDAAGLFVIVARLGDESSGERLTLRLGSARLALTARFDPVNHTAERGTRVDVRGARFVERPAWFRSTLANVLGTAAH